MNEFSTATRRGRSQNKRPRERSQNKRAANDPLGTSHVADITRVLQMNPAVTSVVAADFGLVHSPVVRRFPPASEPSAWLAERPARSRPCVDRYPATSVDDGPCGGELSGRRARTSIWRGRVDVRLAVDGIREKRRCRENAAVGRFAHRTRGGQRERRSAAAADTRSAADDNGRSGANRRPSLSPAIFRDRSRSPATSFATAISPVIPSPAGRARLV